MISKSMAATLIAALAEDDHFSGAVRISQEGTTLFESAVGYANRAWRVKNEIDTRFRVASISKMFTAVAVLQLVDRGVVGLDTAVVDALDLHNSTIPKATTVYHLLTMTAGIADWFDESGDWEAVWAELCRTHPIYLFRENKDYLPLFLNKPPLHPLGTKHQYSNASYILLGLLIETVTGQSYFDFVRQNVFAKAEMHHSDYIALDGISEQVAEGYIRQEDGSWLRNIYSVTPSAAGDGGATSTVRDLTRFSRALRGGKMLSPEQTRAMLTPQVVEDEEPFRGYDWMYGFGNFFILQEGEVVRWGHTGEEDGVSGRLYHYPQHNIDVAILGNQSWCAGKLGWALHDAIIS